MSANGTVRKNLVGSAECRLLGLRDAVDYAQRWLPANRGTN
jgi:aminoglycoside N3'-acetyltransferase